VGCRCVAQAVNADTPADRGRSAQVQLRFAVTAGAARLDDVQIDPRIWR
jgi:hypothetical protein